MPAETLRHRTALLPLLAAVPAYLQGAAKVPLLRSRMVAAPMSGLAGGLFQLLTAKTSEARASNGHPVRPSLMDRLLPRLAGRMTTFEAGNYDAERWSWDGVDRSHRVAMGMSFRQLKTLFARQSEFERAWALLSDEASRTWMEDLLAYRILGHLHVRLPTNSSTHWALREQAKSMPRVPTDVPHDWIFGRLERFTVESEGQSIVVDCSWVNVAWTFLLRQYYFERGVRIRPEPGDHVIDAGAAFGDTALGFAAAVGETGRVWSFDVAESPIFRGNLDRNPHLAGRIELVPHPLGDSAGTPGAQDPSRLPGTTSIDDVVEARGIGRVDFIKMDIEGAELAALRGAERTLRRDRPKLAISAYHREDDLAALPLWIDALGLGYRLYLDHYTTHDEETVLYAIAR